MQKMPGREHTLCFTGHRYYPGGADNERRLAEAVEAACADGYLTFISGMAEGFDLAAAEAVLRKKARYPEIVLVAAVPFRRQSGKYSAGGRERYEAILAAADRVEVLSERYGYGCYYERDDWMVRRSSRVVCWYDGSNGGTRYTVKSALSERLAIVNIYRAPGSLF